MILHNKCNNNNYDIVYKILFYLSFLPILICLVLSLISIFGGASLLGQPIDGFYAFVFMLIAFLFTFTTQIPIIPIAIIYQIIYILIIRKQKGDKNK